MQVLTERDKALQRCLHFLFNFLSEIPSMKRREKINQHFLLHCSLEGTLFSDLLQMEGAPYRRTLVKNQLKFLVTSQLPLTLKKCMANFLLTA